MLKMIRAARMRRRQALIRVAEHTGDVLRTALTATLTVLTARKTRTRQVLRSSCVVGCHLSVCAPRRAG